MLNNFPPLKRRKNDTHIIGNCLQCNDQQQHQDGNCPHQPSSDQFASEFQLLRAATEDPTFDMEDIERRLRKLETKLSSRLHEDGHAKELNSTNDIIQPTSAPHMTTNLNYDNPPQSDADQPIEPSISLTSTGINITTSITESHHFVKLLISGINPTFVQQKSISVFTRHIDLAGPTYDNPRNNQGVSNLAIDKEDPSELQWFDMVLTTRYPMCFLVYQMVEKDKLTEWVSQSYIDGLKGQVKLEHSLLARAVRAFVYNHEKISARHEHGGRPSSSSFDGGGDGDGGDNPLYRNVNPNRGAFYFQQAQELLELCYMTSSRNTIRALLHMYMYQVMNPGGLVKAVQYSDLAIRMAHALKLDKDTNGMLVNEQLREDDRRLWWSTVWVHLWSCTVLNRPFMVEKSAIMGPRGRVPSKRQDESSQVGYCIDFCVHSVKLILLTNSIGQRLGMKTTEAKLLWELQDVEHQLHTWSLALPEVLQPRFWSNNENRTPHSDHMDDIGQHDHPHIRSVHLFAVEIGLLLHGQWARIKMQLYECFWTNDGSILDLLVVRNRLQVALDFTNYLAQSVNQIRPCLLMYFLTTLEPSLTTLNQLAAYEHNQDTANQSIQQLYLLKALLQAYPFTDDPTCQQWIRTIDQTLLQHTPMTLLQPGVDNNIATNIGQPTTFQNTGIITANVSPSISYSDYLHDDEHTLQPDQHYQQAYHQTYLESFVINQEADNSTVQSASFDPSSTTAPFIMLGTDILQHNQQLEQRQQQYEWPSATRTTTLDELALYPIQKKPSNLMSGRISVGQSSHHVFLPNDIAMQSMTTAIPSLSAKAPYLHHESSFNTTNNKNDSSNKSGSSGISDTRVPPLHTLQQHPTRMPSLHSTTTMPLLPPNPALYQNYQQRQHQQVLPSSEQEHRSIKAEGKQPNWSATEIYPDTSSLGPEQHTFLSYSQTNQHGHHRH